MEGSKPATSSSPDAGTRTVSVLTNVLVGVVSVELGGSDLRVSWNQRNRAPMLARVIFVSAKNTGHCFKVDSLLVYLGALHNVGT
jgi:hypothetical protein